MICCRVRTTGLVGPTLFGSLVSSKDRWHLFYGYLLGAGLMMIAAIVVLFLGVNAEVHSLRPWLCVRTPD
jgi:ABC-type Fe3+-siderophore transport system permease subunit